MFLNMKGSAEDVDAAVAAARAAYPSWSQLSGPARAKHLYSLARHVQKHARLLAVLEASNKKTVILRVWIYLKSWE